MTFRNSPKRPRPKQPRAETTMGRNNSGLKRPGTNSQNDSANLPKDLDLLQEWEAQWDMEFNPVSVRFYILPGQEIQLNQPTVCTIRL